MSKDNTFRWAERPDPLVCNKCGKPAWSHAMSSSGLAVDYCHICDAPTTLRRMTIQEKEAAQETAARQISDMQKLFYMRDNGPRRG